MIRHFLVLLALTYLPAAASAADDADALLRKLGLRPAAEVVRVDTAQAANGQVRVTLLADPGVHLVADPGVSVQPVDAYGLPTAAMVELKESGQEYFDAPPQLIVDAGGADRLHVQYAYCVVAKQCLFGDVTVPVD